MARAPARVIDLRSDTVTQPTDEMRDAMSRAEVGDDVMGEDPTVRRLELLAAERVGKEAALFFPSGTMANQAALWVHSQRSGSMVCEEGAHVYYWEAGGPALLSNLLVQTVKGERGVFAPAQVEPLLTPLEDFHYAPLKLIEIENTHNRAGGTCWTPTQTQSIADFSHDHHVPVHLDGARLFNASVALGVSPEMLAGPVDSLIFCVSKGLSAPIGSLLCGSRRFIEDARRVRKILGGGWRQAGVVAAAGIVALETMVDRLQEDHENARRLAVGISKIPGFRIDLETVQTNIVVFSGREAGLPGDALVKGLSAQGIRTELRDVGDDVRLVTHRHIRRDDIDVVLAALRELAQEAAERPTPRTRA